MEDIKRLGINFDQELIFKDETELDITNETIELIGDLLNYFDHSEISTDPTGNRIDGFPASRGSVLVFVTGISCINRIQTYLKQKRSARLKIIPLHAEISIENQCSMVLSPPNPGERKVIISTNIAESSITVPDVKYVVDLCKTKSLFCDKETNYTMLRKEWASKSSMDQRKGRAGKNSFS